MNAAAKPPKLPNVYELMTLAGPFRCRCGVEIGHPGACESCAAKWTAEQFAGFMRPARSSIPAEFRWASFADRETLVKRCGAENVRRVLTLPVPLPVCVAFVGAAGCGKTSLACAYLKRIHDWATPERNHAGVERARRAFFVAATELVGQSAADRQHRERDSRTDFVGRAYRASVLVLDDVEPGKVDEVVYQVVRHRFNEGHPTIITTWMDETEAAKHYGGGWARRAYQTTVNLERAE